MLNFWCCDEWKDLLLWNDKNYSVWGSIFLKMDPYWRRFKQLCELHAHVRSIYNYSSTSGKQLLNLVSLWEEDKKHVLLHKSRYIEFSGPILCREHSLLEACLSTHSENIYAEGSWNSCLKAVVIASVNLDLGF